MRERVTVEPEVASRNVRVSPELMAEWKAWRTLEGDLVTCDWGEPDAEGFYEPQFTIHWDDSLVPVARAAALREVAEKVRKLRPFGKASHDADWGWYDCKAACLAILTEATGASE